jgi:hypothetical protein
VRAGRTENTTLVRVPNSTIKAGKLLRGCDAGHPPLDPCFTLRGPLVQQVENGRDGIHKGHTGMARAFSPRCPM